MFWWLDAYFLHQERLFRELFDQVQNNGKDDSDFSMKIPGKDSQVVSQFKVGMSKTLAWFYGGLLIAVTAVSLIVHFKK